MAEGPKLNAVGEKCKQEIENWETSFKKWWGNLPQNLLAPHNGSAQKARDITKLAQPWWNLPQNLLAAQEGCGPENQAGSEKQFCPETFTMAEDPKAIAAGEEIIFLSCRPPLNPTYTSLADLCYLHFSEVMVFCKESHTGTHDGSNNVASWCRWHDAI